MKLISEPFQNRNVLAWVLMIFTLAIHVFDEATSGFLIFYNQQVINIREQLGFFPIPNFTFEIWITGLIIGIIICFSLTPLVNRGGRFIRIFTIALGIIMIVNALLHMLGSIYFGTLIPGFWSSPLLLLTASFVVVRGFNKTGWRITKSI